jgi:hypothetical protein
MSHVDLSWKFELVNYSSFHLKLDYRVIPITSKKLFFKKKLANNERVSIDTVK